MGRCHKNFKNVQKYKNKQRRGKNQHLGYNFFTGALVVSKYLWNICVYYERIYKFLLEKLYCVVPKVFYNIKVFCNYMSSEQSNLLFFNTHFDCILEASHFLPFSSIHFQYSLISSTWVRSVFIPIFRYLCNKYNFFFFSDLI